MGKANPTDCKFDNNLFSVFTGVNPILDEVAIETLDFAPEYAVFFTLNKTDRGMLFFSKTHSAISWGRKPPRTVPNSSDTVLLVKSLYEKYYGTIRAIFEFVPDLT